MVISTYVLIIMLPVLALRRTFLRKAVHCRWETIFFRCYLFFLFRGEKISRWKTHSVVFGIATFCRNCGRETVFSNPAPWAFLKFPMPIMEGKPSRACMHACSQYDAVSVCHFSQDRGRETNSYQIFASSSNFDF